MMNREETSYSIPTDLLLEIFSRLPAKSILRFRCVSRLWRSLLHRQYFTDLFLTRSSARPRILFVIKNRAGEWSFFSAHQPQNPYEKSSLVVSANFCLNLPEGMHPDFYSLTSGLIHSLKQDGEDQIMHMIFNPSTGRFRILPYHKMQASTRSYLGFDPIDKQYKVLCINNPYEDGDGDCKILTLEHGEMVWRKIQCPLIHYPCLKWVCINGVLYYFACKFDIQGDVIVCFDVRFEKFKFIEAICNLPARLVNYKGKLGLIRHNEDWSHNTEFWVLEDVDKQKWSHYVYTWPKNEIVDLRYLRLASVAGVTSTGRFSIVLESKGVGEYLEKNNYSRGYVFVDYLEDLHFDILRTRYAPISIRPLKRICRPPKSTPTSSKKDHRRKQEPRTFESINKFGALRLLDADDE